MQLLIILLLGFLLPVNSPDSLVEWQSPVQYDLGDIPQNKPVTVEFSFRNLSDSPLTIDNIRAGCGCTMPDWEESPTPPGEIGVIKVTYDARRTGYFNRWVRVYFTGQRKAEKLAIEGWVVE